MAWIRIGVANPALTDSVGPSSLSADLVARASLLLGPDQQPPAQPERRELVVSVGDSMKELDVAPGLWNVELALPSGELLNSQVQVSQKTPGEVLFQLGRSPEKFLDYQFLQGSVPEQADYRRALEGSLADAIQSPLGVIVGRPGTQIRPSVTTAMSKSMGSPVYTDEAFAAAPQARQARSRVQVSLLRLRETVHIDPPSDFDRAKYLWDLLVNGLRLEGAMTDFPGLEIDHEATFDSPQSDAWHDVWTLRLPPGASRERRFAMIFTNTAIEFASLPLPWKTGSYLDDNTIELSVDKSGINRLSRSGVTLRDRRFFGLLSYLKAGSLSLAASLADSGPEDGDMLVNVLRDKESNPLAACAAAYALLGAVSIDRPNHWASWLVNLSKTYSHVPDGAILNARWLALSGKGTPAQVREEFLRAFRRGLPFYALGLAWLLEGLRQFDDNADCKEAARLVRQVSLRSDVSQVFTVLALHPSTDVKLGPAV